MDCGCDVKKIKTNISCRSTRTRICTARICHNEIYGDKNVMELNRPDASTAANKSVARARAERRAT